MTLSNSAMASLVSLAFGAALSTWALDAAAQPRWPSGPPARPPIRLRCDGDPPLAFTITYYATNPGTLVAERRGRKILMTQQPMASGIRYAATGASYAEHQGVSWITWPGQAKPLRCVR